MLNVPATTFAPERESSPETYTLHWEVDPPRRTMLAADPEQMTLQRLLGEATRRDYDASFGAWRGEMAMQWRAAGAAYTEVVTDEPMPHAVRRIAEPPSYGAPAP